MTKAAILISAILLFAGVAAAGSLTSNGGSSTPTLETPTLSTPTTTGAVPQANRPTTTADISGPCDEAEHVNDPRCTGATGAQPRGDDNDRNRGPGNGRDDGDDNRGGNSGPGSTNSGPGGGDDNDD